MTARRLWLPVALTLAFAGCGLKGALEMPEKASNVVIRGPQETAPGAAAPAGSEPPSSAPGREATPVPKPAPAEDDDRQPPPQLPGGNQGSASGG